MLKVPTIRPGLYILVLLLSIPLGYGGYLRTQSVFACTADGYYATTGVYMAYCDAAGYGDYDHGGIWFGLEAEAAHLAASADVLFLGSSRTQFAFSTDATDHWFSAAALSHYLLGFANNENSTFVAPLLGKLKPRAKVYVINIDRFFTGIETGDGSEILHEPDAEQHFKQKQLWQHLHRSLCTRLHAICGHQFAYFRSREHGHWITRGFNPRPPADVADGPVEDQEHWTEFGVRAQQFIASLPVARGCVILTVVPSSKTKMAEAQAVAGSVGLELVNPHLSGLRTFDGSHLDNESAERWSAAFYEIAGAQIRRCTESTGATTVTAMSHSPQSRL